MGVEQVQTQAALAVARVRHFRLSQGAVAPAVQALRARQEKVAMHSARFLLVEVQAVHAVHARPFVLPSPVVRVAQGLE